MKKIVNGLNHSNHNIGTIIAPYMLLDSDPRRPRQRNRRRKLIKVLTFKNHRPIIEHARKAKRKDGKMATNKNQLTWKQYGAISLLTILAIVGLAGLLGSETKHAVTAAFAGMMLLVFALEK